MQILEQSPLFTLWRTESPLMMQVMTALVRSGKEVQPLCLTQEGLLQVQKFHPKAKIALDLKQLPDEKEHSLIWSTDKVFFNSKLGDEELKEIQTVLNDTKNQKLIFILPQNSFEEVNKLLNAHTEAFKRTLTLFVPVVVGFGDKNFFENILESVLDDNCLAEIPQTSCLSIFDLISTLFDLIAQKGIFLHHWIEGSPLNAKNICSSFVTRTGERLPVKSTPSLKSKIKKLLNPKAPLVFFSSAVVPENVKKTTSSSNWERFFRDSYRNYLSTPEGNYLLHFPPTKSP